MKNFHFSSFRQVILIYSFCYFFSFFVIFFVPYIIMQLLFAYGPVDYWFNQEVVALNDFAFLRERNFFLFKVQKKFLFDHTQAHFWYAFFLALTNYSIHYPLVGLLFPPFLFLLPLFFFPNYWGILLSSFVLSWFFFALFLFTRFSRLRK